jgi:hypothetical protein
MPVGRGIEVGPENAPGAAFTPGRDGRTRWFSPIIGSMDSAVEQTPPADTNVSSLHLLRDCLAFGTPTIRRPTAKARLEEALGPELTRKLLESLEKGDRR